MENKAQSVEVTCLEVNNERAGGLGYKHKFKVLVTPSLPPCSIKAADRSDEMAALSSRQTVGPREAFPNLLSQGPKDQWDNKYESL